MVNKDIKLKNTKENFMNLYLEVNILVLINNNEKEIIISGRINSVEIDKDFNNIFSWKMFGEFNTNQLVQSDQYLKKCLKQVSKTKIKFKYQENNGKLYGLAKVSRKPNPSEDDIEVLGFQIDKMNFSNTKYVIGVGLEKFEGKLIRIEEIPETDFFKMKNHFSKKTIMDY